MVPKKDALHSIHCAEHVEMAQECARKAITLVKDTQKLLPLNTDRHKRILLHVLGDKGGYHDFTSGHSQYFRELLERNGFQMNNYLFFCIFKHNLKKSMEIIISYVLYYYEKSIINIMN